MCISVVSKASLRHLLSCFSCLFECRIRELEQQIEAQNERERLLRGENRDISEECERRKRHHEQITAALHESLDQSVAKAVELEQFIEEIKANHIQDVARAQKEHHEVVLKAAKEQKVLESRLQDAQMELQSLQQFQQQRDALTRAAQEAEQEHEIIVKQYEEKLGHMHIRAHKLDQRVQELEASLSQKETYDDELELQSSTDPIVLLQHNRKLASMMRRQDSQIKRMKETLERKEADLEKARAAAAISRDMERRTAKLCAKEAARAAAAVARSDELHSLIRSYHSLSEESSAERQGLKTRLQDSQKEVRALQKRVAWYDRELKHSQKEIRSLLGARSEVQSFLTSSIQCIRRYVAYEHEKEITHRKTARIPQNSRRQESRKGTPCYPPKGISIDNNISKTGSAGVSETKSYHKTKEMAGVSTSEAIMAAALCLFERLKASGGKLAEISALTWDEREAVIRLLLAHINNRNSHVDKALQAYKQKVGSIHPHAGKEIPLLMDSPAPNHFKPT